MTDQAPDSGTHSTAMAKDGVTSVPPKDADSKHKADELEKAHVDADANPGDKKVDNVDRVGTNAATGSEAKALSEADEQATTFERSM